MDFVLKALHYGKVYLGLGTGTVTLVHEIVYSPLFTTPFEAKQTALTATVTI